MGREEKNKSEAFSDRGFFERTKSCKHKDMPSMNELEEVSLLVHGASSTYTENGKTKRKMGGGFFSFSSLVG